MRKSTLKRAKHGPKPLRGSKGLGALYVEPLVCARKEQACVSRDVVPQEMMMRTIVEPMPKAVRQEMAILQLLQSRCAVDKEGHRASW